ncbi:unnamed protein product [Ophioblennius macclurei]
MSEKPKKLPPVDGLTLLPCFYFVELPLVASSLLSLYVLEMTELLQPAGGAFRCFDRRLSMPYVDGGDELVPMLMLLSLVFSGPAASIMLVEGVIYFLQLRSVRRSVSSGGCSFNSFLRRTVRFVGVHVFGLCSTALLTDVIQLCTGYPAPFFLTVCKPNYTLAGASCERERYVSGDICSGTDQQAIMAARKTFPSQHATLSAYAAVYVSMYFNATISDRTKLLKPLLVFTFAVAAAMSGLTQITQHRSHPVDVYVGFAIGAFVAAYLALHAVSNFKSCEDSALPPVAPPPREDPLRALTERGHQSVYHKGPASASDSHDEITTATAPTASPPGARPLQREAESSSSLKRASVGVELLALRSPMGKETMLTFSNTLPRASVANGDDMSAAVTRRLKAVQVPIDLARLRSDSSEAGSTDNDESSQAPLFPAAVHTGRLNPTPPPLATPTPMCGKPVATPRPPQIPDAGPPPVSPKSALTRAKWIAIREKANAASQPRLLQVVAMSKQLPSENTECYSPPAIVTVDAHAPHHPVVLPQAPPLSENPWDDLRGDISSFRPRRSGSPCPDSSVVTPPTDDHRRETATRRKTALVLLDRENHNENLYTSLQARRYKD